MGHWYAEQDHTVLAIIQISRYRVAQSNMMMDVCFCSSHKVTAGFYMYGSTDSLWNKYHDQALAVNANATLNKWFSLVA